MASVEPMSRSSYPMVPNNTMAEGGAALRGEDESLQERLRERLSREVFKQQIRQQSFEMTFGEADSAMSGMSSQVPLPPAPSPLFSDEPLIISVSQQEEMTQHSGRGPHAYSSQDVYSPSGRHTVMTYRQSTAAGNSPRERTPTESTYENSGMRMPSAPPTEFRPSVTSQDGERAQGMRSNVAHFKAAMTQEVSAGRHSSLAAPNDSFPAAPRTWGSAPVPAGRRSTTTRSMAHASSERPRDRKVTVGNFSEEIPFEESLGSRSSYSEAGESEWWTPSAAASRRATMMSNLSRHDYARDDDDDGRAEVPRNSSHNIQADDIPHARRATDFSESRSRRRASSEGLRFGRAHSVPSPSAPEKANEERLGQRFCMKEVAQRRTLAAEALGIPRFAGRKTVGGAYRKAALQNHPDKGGTDACMQVLNAARAKLQRAETRRVS